MDINSTRNRAISKALHNVTGKEAIGFVVQKSHEFEQSLIRMFDHHAGCLDENGREKVLAGQALDDLDFTWEFILGKVLSDKKFERSFRDECRQLGIKDQPLQYELFKQLTGRFSIT